MEERLIEFQLDAVVAALEQGSEAVVVRNDWGELDAFKMSLKVKLPHDCITIVRASQGHRRSSKLKEAVDVAGDKRMVLLTLKRLAKVENPAFMSKVLRVGDGSVARAILNMAALPRIVILTDRSLSCGYNIHGLCLSFLCLTIPSTIDDVRQQVGRMTRISMGTIRKKVDFRAAFIKGTLEECYYLSLKRQWEELGDH